MEAVEIDIVIIIDDQGNVTVEAADDDGETAERHVEEHGISPVMMTHHLKVKVPVPTAATQGVTIADTATTNLSIFKS